MAADIASPQLGTFFAIITLEYRMKSISSETNDESPAFAREHKNGADGAYEKENYENDPLRAREPGADTAYREKDTAADTSDDDAAQAGDFDNAAPHPSE